MWFCLVVDASEGGEVDTNWDGHHDGEVVGWGRQFPLSALSVSERVFLNNLHYVFTNHKMVKKQNFQNRSTKFAKLYTGKLQTKFQDPSI